MQLRLASICAFTLGSLVLLGCESKSESNSARVSGKISYNGKPITAGLMEFHLSDGRKFSVNLSSDGTYQATDVPTGEMVVTVNTEVAKKKMSDKSSNEAKMRAATQQAPPPGRGSAATSEMPEGEYIKIPAKYNNPKTSTKTLTLKPGRQVIDINLDD